MADIQTYEWKCEHLQLMLEAALEGQEAALVSQELILNHSKIPGLQRQAIEGARRAIRITREAALALR